MQSYQTLVRPILEYTSSAWDPYTHQNINKLEALQRIAARFVTGDYRTTSSVSDMNSNLGWETLQQRRTQAKLVMMYRITYGLMTSQPQLFITQPLSVQEATPCATYHHTVGPTLTGAPFYPSGKRLWNQLPEHVVTAPTLETFKGGLPGHY